MQYLLAMRLRCENTIRTLMQSRSCYHNALARLEDEIAINSIKNTLQT